MIQAIFRGDRLKVLDEGNVFFRNHSTMNWRNSMLPMSLSRNNFWRYFTVVGALALAYFGTAKLVLSTLELSVQASPFWPSAGIALAALLLQGRQIWPGVALGAFFVALSVGVSWISACGLAAASALQAAIGAELLRRMKFQPSLNRLQDVLELVVLGAWVSTAVNASLSTLIGLLNGSVNFADWQENWLVLWLGDGLGILVVTPLLLHSLQSIGNLRFSVFNWGTQTRHQNPSKLSSASGIPNFPLPGFHTSKSPVKKNTEEEILNVAEAVICFGFLCAISWFVFGSETELGIARYPLEYLPFPFIVWAALRFARGGAVMATLIVCSMAIWGVAQQTGPFMTKAGTGYQAVLFLHGFMEVVAISALVLAAAESERACAIDLLKEREASLANAQRLAKLGNWDFYETCRVQTRFFEASAPQCQYQLRWSDELYRIFGFTPEAFEPSWEAFFKIVHPEDRERVGQAIRGALRENEPYCLDYRIVRPDGSERLVCERSEIGKSGISGTVQDITDRYSVEAQLRAAAERDRLLGEMALRIRRSLDLDRILDTTVAEVRQFLAADRVFIGQIEAVSEELKVESLKVEGSEEELKVGKLNIVREAFPEGVGSTQPNLQPANLQPSTQTNLQPSTPEQPSTHLRVRAIAESVDPHYPSLLGTSMDDETLLQAWRSQFEQNCVIVIEDTEANSLRFRFASEVSPQIPVCKCEHRPRAVLGVPIWVGDELFGALVVNQCEQPRQWQAWEIDWLASLGTQVAIAIQQAELYRQITDLNAHLESQVEERTQEVSAKMVELQELNHLKDVFLQAVSHDLRTSLLGMSMVLNNLYRSAEETVTLSRPLLERIMTSSDRQLNLIDSLLEDHFHEKRPLEVQCQPVSVDRLIQDLISKFSPMLARNQATLTARLPENCPLIPADPTQLGRVIENLLCNAVKHNPPGLNLTLELVVEGEMIRCTLTDDGVGMSQQQQDSLFKLYVRGLHAQHLTGIGLGLYQCRQIVAAHGGQIGVISTPGVGSTFWFTVPVVKAGVLDSNHIALNGN